MAANNAMSPTHKAKNLVALTSRKKERIGKDATAAGTKGEYYLK
jgi:hypothetical protein